MRKRELFGKSVKVFSEKEMKISTSIKELGNPNKMYEAR
jgi:hypothetical protein